MRALAALISMSLIACRTPVEATNLKAVDAEAASPASPASAASAGEDGCLAALQSAMALVAGKKAVDWTSDLGAMSQEAFRVCLGAYVRLQTVNPPGNEEIAVKWLSGIFAALEIPHVEVLTEGRSNLVATLSWDGNAYATTYDWAAEPARGGVGLYHHADVVAVHPEQWQDASRTFSGEVIDGHLWGRGSIDMKSYGVLQLISLALRKAAAAPATFDLHMIVGADEEVAATGARGLMKAMALGGKLRALAKMDVILNEGGFGIKRQGKNVFVIASEEKGGAWLEFSHPDPRALVQQLHLAMNLTQPAAGWKKKLDLGGKCAWTSYDTPGSQVNVVPSIGDLTIACQSGVVDAEKLRQAFLASFDAESGVAVDVAPEGETFRVKITLGSSGHGSLGGNSALQVAAAGLNRIGILQLDPLFPKKAAFYKYQRTPGIDSFVRTMGKLYYIPSFVSDLTQHISFLDQKFLKTFGNAAYSEALFRTTCAWTSLIFKKGEPAKALADCRLVHTGNVSPEPTEHGSHFVAEVKERVTDAGFGISLVQGWNFGGSPLTTPDFKILVDSLAKVYPDAKITAFLAPTSSDSTWFRAPVSAGSSLPPFRSYGFFPMILPSELTATIHGSNERLPLAQAEPAARIYVDAVGRLVSR